LNLQADELDEDGETLEDDDTSNIVRKRNLKYQLGPGISQAQFGNRFHFQMILDRCCVAGFELVVHAVACPVLS
jgi:hypothetical protein